MAEDPRPFLHFKTLAKFKEKLADGTVNPDKHFVVIKKEGLVWIKGKMLVDNGRLEDLESYYDNWELNPGKDKDGNTDKDKVQIILKGHKWEWTEWEDEAHTKPLKGHWIENNKSDELVVATEAIAGLMSTQDKAKLNKVETTNFALGAVTPDKKVVNIAASKLNPSTNTSIPNNIVIPNAEDDKAGVITGVEHKLLNTDIPKRIGDEETRAKEQENTIEAAVGLNEDGTHKTTTGNYTSTATTIAGEIAALDAALKTTDTNFSNRRSFKTITGDSGTATADQVEDTLKIAGGTDLTTVATDTSNADVLTINHDAITRTDPTDSTKTITVPSDGTTDSMNKMVKSVTSSTTGHTTAVQHETVSFKHGNTTRTNSTNVNTTVEIPSDGTEKKLGDKVESVTSSATGHVTDVTTGNITVKHGDTTRTDTNTTNVDSVPIPADGTSAKINDAVVSITSNAQGHITAVTKNNLTVNHGTVTTTPGTDYLVTGLTVNNGHVTGTTTKSFDGDITLSDSSTNGKIKTTISNNVVTNAKLADMTANTIKGAVTAGDPVDLTPAQVRTMINVANGAEVNQNAFSIVKVGTTNIEADSKTDTLEIAAGTNIAITPDAANDKVTISVTGTLTSDNIPSLDASKITSGTLGTERIPNLSADKINSGTLGVDRIPNLASSKITSGTLDTARIPNLDASKITSGTISIDRLPKGALERLTIVANATARKALTTDSVQNGDTVKETDTGLMYYVKDDTKLNQDAGWEVYVAGSAASVPWSGVTDKPNYAGSNSIGGSANSAVKLDTATAGSSTQPVYFTEGKPKACDYSLNKTVPSDAIFTDTVYTHPKHTAAASGLYKVTVDDLGHVTATTAVTKADITGLGIPGSDTNTTYSTVSTTADGLAPKLPNNTTQYLRGDGSWATPPDNNTTYSTFTGASTSANGTSGLVPAPTKGDQGTKYLKADGTWAVPAYPTSVATLTTARNLWGNSFNGSADVNGTMDLNGNYINNCTNIVSNSTLSLKTNGENDISINYNNDDKTSIMFNGTTFKPYGESSETISLGSEGSYWKEVQALKYVVKDGTSSQFLKADGSLDDTEYATKDVVTTSANGLMSSDDKTRFDNTHNWYHQDEITGTFTSVDSETYKINASSNNLKVGDYIILSDNVYKVSSRLKVAGKFAYTLKRHIFHTSNLATIEDKGLVPQLPSVLFNGNNINDTSYYLKSNGTWSKFGSIWGKTFNGSTSISGDMSNVGDISFKADSTIGGSGTSITNPTGVFCNGAFWSYNSDVTKNPWEIQGVLRGARLQQQSLYLYGNNPSVIFTQPYTENRNKTTQDSGLGHRWTIKPTEATSDLNIYYTYYDSTGTEIPKDQITNFRKVIFDAPVQFNQGYTNSGSDMRYKENVKVIDNVLDDINDFDVISYTWNREGDDLLDTFGISADQLLEKGGVFAKMVHERTDKSKTKFVDYDRFGVLAIKAIQELYKEVKELRKEVQELKQK